MAIKVKDVVQKAAGSFKAGNTQPLQPGQISRAQAMGLREPPLSNEAKAGVNALAGLASDQAQARIDAHLQYQREKADFEKKRDAAIWEKIERRRKASL